jgi:acetoin:2,6-dichlorophenolindophenol oxidoreductase subunit alpha
LKINQYDLDKVKLLISNNKLKNIKINKSLIYNLFYFMIRLRNIELKLSAEYHPADEIRCPVHFCVGQEAIPAAISENINKQDYIFSHHRSHGYYFAKHAPINPFFAELYGRETGTNKGLAGSQDISYSNQNFFSGAILGGAISISIGTGLGLKLNKKKNIVYSCFGESATDQGIFWESINYASLEKLPILFICENNNYSVFSPQRKRQSGNSIAFKSRSFGVESIQINGNDSLDCYLQIKKIKNKILKEKKPFLIEAFTSRWSGHYGPGNDDNIAYRDNGEISFWKKNCPIKKLKKEFKISDKFELDCYNKSNIEIKRAFSYAKKSNFMDEYNWDELNYASTNNFLKDIEKIKKYKPFKNLIYSQAKGY